MVKKTDDAKLSTETINVMNCSLDEIVAQEKKTQKKSWNNKGWKNNWKGKGWKNNWNNKGGWKKWNNKGGWKKWGKWKKGGWKSKKWTGGWKGQNKPTSPLEQLQTLCQKNGLAPTISVEEKNEKGMKVAIEIDVSKLNDEKPGTSKVKEIHWGKDLDEAKSVAVKAVLKHEKIAPHVKTDVASLFPGQKLFPSKDDEDEETWISASCFKSNGNLALKLFERFCKEKSLAIKYEETGEYPKCEVKCFLDGELRGTGTAKGSWGAKKFAIKEAYFWCKNNLKTEAKAETKKTATPMELDSNKDWSKIRF